MPSPESRPLDVKNFGSDLAKTASNSQVGHTEKFYVEYLYD